MNFDWDDAKARANEAKHSISFDEAKAVFDDTNAIIDYDESDPEEDRWRIIGLSAAKVLFVVFAETDEDVTRIISARRASRHEQDRYYRQALS